MRATERVAEKLKRQDLGGWRQGGGEGGEGERKGVVEGGRGREKEGKRGRQGGAGGGPRVSFTGPELTFIFWIK